MTATILRFLSVFSPKNFLKVVKATQFRANSPSLPKTTKNGTEALKLPLFLHQNLENMRFGLISPRSLVLPRFPGSSLVFPRFFKNFEFSLIWLSFPAFTLILRFVWHNRPFCLATFNLSLSFHLSKFGQFSQPFWVFLLVFWKDFRLQTHGFAQVFSCVLFAVLRTAPKGDLNLSWSSASPSKLRAIKHYHLTPLCGN